MPTSVATGGQITARLNWIIVLQRIRAEYQRWESQMLPLPERRASGGE
jgi:hypothetical protein